jgi:hypothetical protein
MDNSINRKMEKHLEFIQSVINRHNANSFMLKGWTITLCTAILVMASAWKEPLLSLMALVPITVFWILDSVYLANERCFVSLYNAVVNGNKLKVKNKDLLKKFQVVETNEDGIKSINPEKEFDILTSNYSMNFNEFKKIERNNWFKVLTSNTILWFYLMLASFSILLFIALIFINKPKSTEPIKISAKIENDSLFIRTETPRTTINNIIIGDSILQTNTIKKNN